MAFSITSNYAGEVAEGIITNLVTGNQTVAGGHIHVVPSIKKIRSFPKLTDSGVVQDYAATPTSNGTMTITEVQLGVGHFLFYEEFNPFDLDEFWKPQAANSPLLYKELDPEIQVALVSEVLKGVENWWERNIWQGSTAGSAPNDKFDGIVTKAIADVTVKDVGTPTAITSANVVAKLDAARALATEAEFTHPDYKYIMGWTAWQAYVAAQQNQSNKGVDFTSGGQMTYWGKPVVHLSGVPADTIIGIVASNTSSSNIALGVEAIGDGDLVQVAKKQANSDLYFVKMNMKAGTLIKNGAEMVMHNV